MKHRILALLICLSLLSALCACSGQQAEPSAAISSADASAPTAEAAETTAPSDKPSASATAPEAAPAEQEPEATEEESEAPTSTASGSGNSSGYSHSGSAGSSSASPKSSYLSFPYRVGTSDLYIDAVLSYDGMYVEDGSDRNVTSVAAIRIANAGNTPVEYARLTLEQGSRRLEFVATCLLPYSTMLVLESSAQKASTEGYTSCELALGESSSLEEDSRLLVEETEDGVLQVTNLTEETLSSARIYYKIYMPDDDVFVGGITYTVNLENLAPNEPVTVMPTHYSSGYSKIIMSRIYP